MSEEMPDAPAPDAPKKRPASQYYWGDWWKDKGLHACSLPARGLWHEMNCLMHEGEPYGHLTLNGRPMTVAQLANQCRISAPQCKKLLDELTAAGVPSVTADGVLFSRRMVRDEAVRNARAAGGKDGAEHGIKGAESGAKGGRPKGSKGGSETPLTGGSKPPPSSSSSSSTSEDTEDFNARSGRGPGGAELPETKAGAVGLAFKRAGVDPMTLNLGDPRLAELLRQGATPEEFEGLAREAIRQGVDSPYPWVLSVLPKRRAAAAAITLAAPPADPEAWRKGGERSVRAMAEQLGLRDVGEDERWPDFENRVLQAWRRKGSPAPQQRRATA
jgi:hypothetical protein